jgi:hypothetical protein
VRRGRVQMHTSLGPASRGELARRCSDRGAEEEWQHPGCETAGEHACVGSAAVLWPPSPPVHCLLAFSPAPGSSQRLPPHQSLHHTALEYSAHTPVTPPAATRRWRCGCGPDVCMAVAAHTHAARGRVCGVRPAADDDGRGVACVWLCRGAEQPRRHREVRVCRWPAPCGVYLPSRRALRLTR